jgi:hypothetical protein
MLALDPLRVAAKFWRDSRPMLLSAKVVEMDDPTSAEPTARLPPDRMD